MKTKEAKWFTVNEQEPSNKKLMFVTRDEETRIHIGWKLHAMNVDGRGTVEKRLFSADTKRMYKLDQVEKWTELEG